MIKRISVGERLVEDIQTRKWLGAGTGRGGVESLCRLFGLSEEDIAQKGCVLALISSIEYNDARRISRSLVSSKMALRAEILPKVSSIFWDNGNVEEIDESFMIVMTKEDMFPDVVQTVRNALEDSIPEIITLPVFWDNSRDTRGQNAPAESGTEITIAIDDMTVRASLNNSDTACRVLEVFPITSSMNVWGKELYFAVPVSKQLENGRDIVGIGDIAYWPPARAVCIFLGETPLSRNGEIRPLTPVEVIGKVENPQALLEYVVSGRTISICK